ncbi:tryptophan-rich sensory protein [Thiothrix subterranea]|uniref:tryptophan-rich sensory protein n=1 Tax=Thiothrix subterranea TaxID=2735563 RepID=UPI00280A854A|nr:tryptophan-rich sensory protein [Thiothrix subterranea]
MKPTFTRKSTEWGGALAAFVLMVLVNALSNVIPFGGQTQKDISDKYPTLFTPDGFTFSIWGVIYLSLTGFVIYQALPAQRHNTLVSSVTRLFILTCIANIVWLFCWHYEQLWLSLLVMVVLLVLLVKIYRTLGIATQPFIWTQRLLLVLPFSLYTGWITVATIANLTIVQQAMGWENAGLDAINWTLLKLAIAAVISAIVILKRHDMIYGLVIAWAAYGIMSKQSGTPEIASAALLLVAVAVMLVAYQGVSRLWKSP